MWRQHHLLSGVAYIVFASEVIASLKYGWNYLSVLPQLVKPTNYYTSDGSNDFHKHSSSLVLITVCVVCSGLLLILTALFIIAVICGYNKWRRQRTNILDVSLAHRPRENSGISFIYCFPTMYIELLQIGEAEHSMIYNEIYNKKHVSIGTYVCNYACIITII